MRILVIVVASLFAIGCQQKDDSKTASGTQTCCSKKHRPAHRFKSDYQAQKDRYQRRGARPPTNLNADVAAHIHAGRKW